MGDKKKHIKQPGFGDRNISAIEHHQQKGKTFVPPLKNIPNLQFTSWTDLCLPDSLWLVLLSGNLERNHYFEISKKILNQVKKNAESLKDFAPIHSSFRELSPDLFDKIFSEFSSDPKVSKIFSALLAYEELPDRDHWKRNFPKPDPKKQWNLIARGVGKCFPHQSQKATDCRWFRVMWLFAIDKIRFAEGMEDFVEAVLRYPENEDLSASRIRASEIAFRQSEISPLDEKWAETFWRAGWKNTSCVIPDWKPEKGKGYENLKSEIMKIYDYLIDHFTETLEITSPNPRHDGAFGIVMYILQTLLLTAVPLNANSSLGRLSLRCILEAYLTLKFLCREDKETIWAQYRNHGNSAAKLAFLKNLREAELPESIDLNELENYANEDLWMEFQNIELGVWSNKNLREMAQLTGEKTLYDKFYDILSGYSHSNWFSIRDTIFTTCLNPLHRFHRVPFLPKFEMLDVTPDACKIANLALEELNSLYPTIKQRIHWHQKKDKSETG
ncbi:MAG: hypothetical protein IIA70_00840 [Proteobacteria bacterium]|nr:hypothetical protein [Pseudomonadota bacterium]